MKDLIFVNIDVITNAGDYWSSPLRHYNFDSLIADKVVHDIRRVHFIDIARFVFNQKGYEKSNIKNSIVVLGGGGLITTKDNFCQSTVEYLVENNLTIFWGAGSNTFGPLSYNILNHSNIMLAGVRDMFYGMCWEYVPCVSCKHEVFNLPQFEVVGEIGLYENIEHPIKIDGYDRVKNDIGIYEAVKFISSHEAIITTSYHGLYWSQLLGKKVVYYCPDGKRNSKFANLKHGVEVCDDTNYKQVLYYSSTVTGMLLEARHINDTFFQKVMSGVREIV